MAGTLHKSPRYVHTQECLGLARTTGMSSHGLHSRIGCCYCCSTCKQRQGQTMEGVTCLQSIYTHRLSSKCDDLGCRHAPWDLDACSSLGVLYMPIAVNVSSMSSNCLKSISFKTFVWVEVLDAHTSCRTHRYIYQQRIGYWSNAKMGIAVAHMCSL